MNKLQSMSKNTSYRVHVQTASEIEVNDVVTNGLSVKMIASDSGQLHDVIYFIQRTQNHKY